MRTTREEWAKRVRRWQDSELTANEFAREVGINARTLTYWKWRLGKEERKKLSGGKGRGGGSSAPSLGRTRASRKPTFVEVTPSQLGLGGPIEVVPRGGTVVRVPDGFRAETLRRVLHVIGGGEE